MNPAKSSLSSLFFFLAFPLCSSIDIIAPNQSIKDGDVLVSDGQRYALGFFSPGNSTRRYVGIWYHEVSEQTVVWVANRDNPVNDTSGVLAIDNQGNLALHANNRSSVTVWSTNVSASSMMTDCLAQLLDTGNLVLVQRDSKRVLWQSFDHATDTLLPDMKLGLDLKIGLNWSLSSWKSKDDPGTGTVSYGIDPSGDGSGFGPPRKINVTATVNVVKIATVIPYKADDFICNCLPGFEPVSPREWYLRDGSKGCIRKPNVSTCHSGEGFVKLARVKVPDTSMARANMSLSLKECEQECSRNCSCTAYASADERGIGCLRWHGDLVDMRTYTEVGQEIYIRVDAAELAKYRKSRPLAKAGIQAALIVSVGVALFLIVFLVCCFIRKKKKASDRNRSFLSSPKYLGNSSD
ncbi:hypothetical protein OIU76_026082 [Salix suchowensis]|nr:hypothetical protein OIU76_026082 [Salix suchowensis]